MGVLLIKICTFTAALFAGFQVAIGFSFQHQQYFRRPSSFYSSSFKQISAAVPFFQDYDVEVLRPMSQMSQRKHVPVYLVPQSSFHMYPTVGSSAHLSAIEIPLAEPMVLNCPKSEVLAPMGFTVFSHGSLHPFYTVALLAPVPPGTHVSRDSPVIINVLYAVPKLPQLPSYQNVLTQIPVPSSTTTEKSPVVSVPGLVMETKPDSFVTSEDDTVSIPLDDQQMHDPMSLIDNAKESPYLQELRLESLQQQLEELQDQIRKIKRLKN